MNTFKVRVERRLGYYYATTGRAPMRYMLCNFNESPVSDAWRFRIPQTGNAISITNEEKPGEFPYEYFINLCKSLLFIEYGTGEMPEVELTVQAKKLLKIK